MAYLVESSDETKPDFSVAYLQGGVKMPSDTKQFKENDNALHFSVFSEPGSGYDRETYLYVFVSAFGDLVSRIKRLKLHEKSYIRAVGKLEAGSKPDILCMKLYDVTYAGIQAKKEKES